MWDEWLLVENLWSLKREVDRVNGLDKIITEFEK